MCMYTHIYTHVYVYVCVKKQSKFFHQNSKTIYKLAANKLGCYSQHNQQLKYCGAHSEKEIFKKYLKMTEDTGHKIPALGREENKLRYSQHRKQASISVLVSVLLASKSHRGKAHGPR